MSLVQVQSLIEAGVHFGHRVSRWHPRMRPYIFGKRNLIHIVDIRQTVRGLVRASNTQPVLVLRFEGDTRESLRTIKRTVADVLGRYIDTEALVDD